ncbi:MAG: N-acetyltransferase [Bryobacteraceae bacterium]|jgi:GNAT superfamily N-acetyltransferase
MSMDLARRLESAEALDGVACAQAHQRLNPELGATVLEVAGGSAIFVGVDSPLTHAMGLGMRGAVRAAEMDRIEDFYRSRGAAASLELCPLADASLVELLGKRGYRVTEFLNVLVRLLAGAEIAPAGIARLACVEEELLWTSTVGRGFLEKDELTPEEMDVGRAIWHMAGSRCYLAFSGGRAAAAGAMAVHGGLATLFADSTLLGFRGAGLQAALIRERLRVAAAEGCDLATASTLPGTVSQRNYERNGFHVAYTKAILVR